MPTLLLSLEDVIQMTHKTGENWAVAHAKRLIELVKQMSAGHPCDLQIMELAAYLHGWGAFSVYTQKCIEHALRSRQVVEAEILPRPGMTPDRRAILLEAIELHDEMDQFLGWLEAESFGNL